MSTPIQVSPSQAVGLFLENQALAEPLGTPDEVVSRLFAVQVQYAASLGMSVAARVKRMKPSWPDDACNTKPTLYKTWSLRSTLHVHCVADRDLVHAISQRRYQWFLHSMKRSGLDAKHTHAQEALILEAMKGGPVTRTELHDRVPALKDLSWTGWGQDVKGLAYRGELILAPCGPGATKFTLARDWLGSLPTPMDEHEADAQVLLRYLASHGPASEADFRYWMGVYATSSKAAFAAVKDRIVPVQVEGYAETRYVLPDHVERLMAAKPSGVRLLAKFDPLMLAHKDKRMYLAPKFHKTVCQKAGQVEATVLIDGKIAGIWRIDRKATTGTISVQPFRPFKPREVGRLEKEADRLRKALGLKAIELRLDGKHV